MVLKALVAGAGLWWLFSGKAKPSSPTLVGPGHLPKPSAVSGSIQDVMLSQNLCMHIRSEPLERSPGQAVRVTAVIAPQAVDARGRRMRWTYRVKLDLINAGQRIPVGKSGSVTVPANRQNVTINATIRTPDLAAANTYQLVATLQSLIPGTNDVLAERNWNTVVDALGPVRMVLDNALRVVRRTGGRASVAAVVLSQDKVYR